ncbi:hypothetical protein KY362_00545 [Candidatus Woesearchaeota archaeon]|nr:hypothetical protein [Candidatus Woesearchaeota archaeon]
MRKLYNKPDSEHIPLVNRLVEASFGKRFRADRCRTESVFSENVYAFHEPHDIIMFSWFQIPLIWEPYTWAGRFKEPDGSSIEVFGRFEGEAREYARMYEAETGKGVEVKII